VKVRPILFIVLIMVMFLTSCRQKDLLDNTRILFLHHSTGQKIWDGNRSTFLSAAIGKINTRLSGKFYKRSGLPLLFDNYNRQFNKGYIIRDLIFPKNTPYGWHNYPYDYYNIWVKNAGDNAYMEEPTLEMLTKEFQVIIFKHCFPVSNIQADKDSGNVDSDFKSLANYKLQYHALRDKLSEFRGTKFILFTGAVQVKSQISEDEAKRAKEFFDWVIKEWDLPDDNIYIWDLYNLQTDGGIYFKDINASSETNSHPNEIFSDYASKLLFNRIIDVIKTNGSETTLTGERK
jgi:hypothetical protein